jgi:hypothetical protein
MFICLARASTALTRLSLIMIFLVRATALHCIVTDVSAVVVDSSYFVGPKLVEKGEFNTTLMHRHYFEHLVRDGIVW